MAGCSGERPSLAVEEARVEGVKDKPFVSQARAAAARLDDRVLAAQVMMTGIDGQGTLTGQMEALLQAVPVGAILLFSRNLRVEKEAIRPFLDSCALLITASSAQVGEAGIPPFIAVDHEGGMVHRFGDGVYRLPSPAFYGEMALREGRDAALGQVAEDAWLSGQELRAMGITMNLAPVVEILNRENQVFLEDRSYGADGAFTGEAAAAFIHAMDAAGICPVAKHFPGNSAMDPHKGPVRLEGDREALGRMTAPFAHLIRRGDVRALMVSHALVPAWDEKRIASLSPAVLGQWLREELGFRGIILADDFSMTAAEYSGLEDTEAVVEALDAGADMIITWPSRLIPVHRAIVEALESGRLSRNRLRDAAERILEEKIRAGL